MTPAPTTTATAAAVVALAFHVWALYRDHGPPNPRWFPHADKAEHLIGFGLPCFLVLLALHLHAVAAGRTIRTRTIALVATMFVVHAAVSEVLQGALYTTRTGDPCDALADVVGTAFGVLAFLAVRRRLVRGTRGRG